jgi:hypothetical protein
MVTESNSDNDSENQKVILCDFEYSSYSYRGYDFGCIFSEWGLNRNDFKTLKSIPKDSSIKPFIREYINEYIRIKGLENSDNIYNSEEQLLREVKIFAMVSNVLLVCICLKNDSLMGEMPFEKKQTMVCNFQYSYILIID